MESKFKVQGHIRSKGHVDFIFLINFYKEVTLRNLLFHRIFLVFEGKKFSNFKFGLHMNEI
jgi:hypothetical protein